MLLAPQPTPSAPTVVVPPIHVQVENPTDPVAFAALAVSLFVLGWELVKFWREGGRIRVKLRVGTWDGYALAQGPRRFAKYWKARSLNRTTLEVAIVEVENFGRMPVTVRSIQFEYGRQWHWTSGRRSVSYVPIGANDTEEDLPVRIEPFDAKTFVFDAAQVMNGIWSRKKPPVKIFASAQVGAGRPVKSSRWRAWRFYLRTHRSLLPSMNASLELQIFRFLTWHLRKSKEPGHRLAMAAHDVAALVESGTATADEISSAILARDDQAVGSLAAYYLEKALSEPAGTPFDGLVPGSAAAPWWSLCKGR